MNLPTDPTPGPSPLVPLLARIPVRVRQTVYAVLGIAGAVQAIDPIIPSGIWQHIAGIAAALGFGAALSNTPKK